MSSPTQPEAVEPTPGAVPPRSYEEGARQFMEAMGQRQGSTPAGPGSKPAAPAKPSGQSLWTRLKEGDKGGDALGNTIPRGIINAIDDTAETLLEIGASPFSKNPRQFAQNATGFIDKTRDALFGPRSDSRAVGFVEDTAQFVAGFYGTGKLKIFGKLLNTLSPVVGGAVRGAIVDFAMFDPEQAQLAELAASSNIPGVKWLGEVLSVDGDDGVYVSRFKRVAGGLIPGVALDGLVASARLFRSAKVLGDVKAAPAAKAAAKTVAQDAIKVLSDIEAGTHQPEGAVVARQMPDGRYEVVTKETAAAGFPKEGDVPAVSRETADAAMNGEIPRAVLDDTGTMHVGKSPEIGHAEIIATAQRGGAEFNSYTPKQRGWANAEQFVDGDGIDAAYGQRMSPTFETRWEAEAHAASTNEVMAQRFAAKATVLSPEQTTEILTAAKEIEAAGGDPEKILDAFKKVSFNFTHLDQPSKLQALYKAANEHLTPALNTAQGRPEISLSESIDRTIELAGMIPREHAEEYLRTVGKIFENADANLLMMNTRLDDLASTVGKWSTIADARPLDKVAERELRKSLQGFIDQAARVSGVNSAIGRALNALKARGHEALKDLKFKGDAGAPTLTPKAAEAVQGVIEGMPVADLREVAGLFRMTKEPRALFDTISSEIRPNEGSTAAKVGLGVLEVFYNSVLSHPATHLAIFAGNGAVSLMEDGVRILAGVAKMDKELIASGTDILSGRLIFLKQSLVGMKMAYKAGHSIIDPKPVYKSIPGLAGEVVRTMGSRPMSAMDEFWRVNNNLAYVRMQALKLARRDAAAQGVVGKELDRFVSARAEAAVKASLHESGASRLPEARAFAALPTFSSPLREGSFGAGLEKLVQDHPFLVPIMPFVRTSVNVMSYSFVKSTPLGLFTKQAKEIMAAGGDDAAILGTRMAVGTTIWATAGLLAFNGSITGRGPSDPKLRQMWLATNQPYSVKVGDSWVSYRRAEPFASALSLTADLAHILRDNSHDLEVQGDAEKVWFGILASAASSITNKTYLSGLVDFMAAISSGSPREAKNFWDGLMQVAVPNVVQVANDDPYLRQTQDMFDALQNRVPGWSKNLPARYDVFGDPIALKPGRQQRSLNPFPIQDRAGAKTEQDILALDRALTPPPTVEKFGKWSVNLHDRKYQAAGSNLTPYERMMDLVKDQDLRGTLDKLIASDKYERAGDGTDVFAGGRKFTMIEREVDRVYDSAKKQMLKEYPVLEHELKSLNRAVRASKRSDNRAESILDALQ